MGEISRTKKGDCKVLTVTCVLWDWLKVLHLRDSINYWKCCVMDQSSFAVADAMGIIKKHKRSSGDLTGLLFLLLPSPTLYNNSYCYYYYYYYNYCVNDKILEHDWLLTALIYGLIGSFRLGPNCLIKF